jgi:hypothetical protein
MSFSVLGLNLLMTAAPIWAPTTVPEASSSPAPMAT